MQDSGYQKRLAWSILRIYTPLQLFAWSMVQICIPLKRFAWSIVQICTPLQRFALCGYAPLSSGLQVHICMLRASNSIDWHAPGIRIHGFACSGHQNPWICMLQASDSIDWHAPGSTVFRARHRFQCLHWLACSGQHCFSCQAPFSVPWSLQINWFWCLEHVNQWILMPGAWKPMDSDAWNVKIHGFRWLEHEINGFWCLEHENPWILMPGACKSIGFHWFSFVFIDLEGSWEGRMFWFLRVLRVLRLLVSHPAPLLVYYTDSRWPLDWWQMDNGRLPMADSRWPIADGR